METTESLLRQLIAFDTTCRTSNRDLITFVEAWLARHGIASQRVPATSDPCNLYVTIGPADVPGVMLAGHTDTVPVIAENWRSDPFCMDARDDRLYGRGTADMKGFIAAVLAAVPLLVSRKLRMPVHLAFTYDEEIGCVGVRDLLTYMQSLAVKPRCGIVGEPTSMRVAVAHKGKIACRVQVTGKPCHSRNPDEGVNAIDAATDIIRFIRDMAIDRRRNGPRDAAYIFPASSIQVGRIDGGTAVNIVPAQCAFDFEIRYLPQEDAVGLIEQVQHYARTQVLPAMQAVDAHCDITFTTLTDYPGLAADGSDSVLADIVDLIGDDAPQKLAFGSEGGLYARDAGIPCIVFGPGSIGDAHQPDEYVSRSQLAQCDRFLEQLVDYLSV